MKIHASTSPVSLQGKQYFYSCEILFQGTQIDLLSFLEGQDLFPKMYFRENRRERAVLGCALSLSQIPDLPPNYPSTIRFFGGMQFFQGENKDEKWKDFPSCYFFLPQIEIFQDETCCTIYRHSIEENQASFSSDLVSLNPLGKLLERKNAPEKEDFSQILLLAQEKMKTTSLEKVVLARRSDFTFSEKVNPYFLVQNLPKENVHCFLFQSSKESAFLGATPEVLYSRKGDLLQTMALAATRKKDKDGVRNSLLQKELLSREKDLEEFKKVEDFIKTVCESLCSKVEISPLQVYETSATQHLYKTFNGILHSYVRDPQILSSLHPTPALGGFPKEDALSFLHSHEVLERGWYGSPLGWISPKETHLVVGIRSALAIENILSLYSGVGIVPNSRLEEEWEELEIKISPFTRMFL